MKRTPLPCSWLLPLAAILLWTCTIAAPATLLYVRLLRAAHGHAAATLVFGPYRQTVPRNHFLLFSLDRTAVVHGNINEAVNIYGLAGEALASGLFGTWPESWYPEAFDLMSWRGVIFPFFCLPFWIFAGRGLDGLLRRTHLRWWTLLGGTLLCILSIAMALGLHFDAHPEDDIGTYRVSGLLLWSVLTAVFPVQWGARAVNRRKA